MHIVKMALGCALVCIAATPLAATLEKKTLQVTSSPQVSRVDPGAVRLVRGATATPISITGSNLTGTAPRVTLKGRATRTITARMRSSSDGKLSITLQASSAAQIGSGYELVLVNRSGGSVRVPMKIDVAAPEPIRTTKPALSPVVKALEPPPPVFAYAAMTGDGFYRLFGLDPLPVPLIERAPGQIVTTSGVYEIALNGVVSPPCREFFDAAIAERYYACRAPGVTRTDGGRYAIRLNRVGHRGATERALIGYVCRRPSFQVRRARDLPDGFELFGSDLVPGPYAAKKGARLIFAAHEAFEDAVTATIGDLVVVSATNHLVRLRLPQRNLSNKVIAFRAQLEGVSGAVANGYCLEDPARRRLILDSNLALHRVETFSSLAPVSTTALVPFMNSIGATSSSIVPGEATRFLDEAEPYVAHQRYFHDFRARNLRGVAESVRIDMEVTGAPAVMVSPPGLQLGDNLQSLSDRCTVNGARARCTIDRLHEGQQVRVTPSYRLTGAGRGPARVNIALSASNAARVDATAHRAVVEQPDRVGDVVTEVSRLPGNGYPRDTPLTADLYETTVHVFRLRFRNAGSGTVPAGQPYVAQLSAALQEEMGEMVLQQSPPGCDFAASAAGGRWDCRTTAGIPPGGALDVEFGFRMRPRREEAGGTSVVLPSMARGRIVTSFNGVGFSAENHYIEANSDDNALTGEFTLCPPHGFDNVNVSGNRLIAEVVPICRS